jgi:hypothetical protein
MFKHFSACVICLNMLTVAAMTIGCDTSPASPTLPSAPPPAPAPDAVEAVPTSLTASPGVVTPGDQLTVKWVGPSGHGCSGGGDWIALYQIGEPDVTGASNGHSDLWFTHVCGASSGTSTLRAPGQPGDYEFRFMVGDTAIARSNPVRVNASSS